MNTVLITPTIIRKTIPITFSKEFEGLLLSYASKHTSLTEDLELHIQRGLKLLEELEDVHDLQHVDTLRALIATTNQYLKIDTPNFQTWFITIAEELVDEADLLLLTHGEDLAELGLETVNQGTILVLLATASFNLHEPLKNGQGSVVGFKNRFKKLRFSDQI